jgi:hypothetical protein
MRVMMMLMTVTVVVMSPKMVRMGTTVKEKNSGYDETVRIGV